MRISISFTLFLCAGWSFAQPFAIGHSSMVFHDDERDRDVPTELYYPAVSPGDDVPVAAGTFPVVVIGHGFVMGVDAYSYLWEHFTPRGYIVALPTTEGDLSPEHAEFGADLAFLAKQLEAANIEGTSPFFGHVAPTVALMGHSMGGGAAFLGCVNEPAITTLVAMAPAETDPSAIAAAAAIGVPALMFVASEDCVTPIAAHAQPMYEALASTCKAFVNVTGGGHCYFGDNSFTCSFGELTCDPDLTISRVQQHQVVLDITDLWFDRFLRDDQAAFEPLSDSLATSPRFVAINGCLSTGSDVARTVDALPVISQSDAGIVLSGLRSDDRLTVFDTLGRSVQVIPVTGDRVEVDASLLPTGPIFFRVRGAAGTHVLRAIVIG